MTILSTLGHAGTFVCKSIKVILFLNIGWLFLSREKSLQDDPLCDSIEENRRWCRNGTESLLVFVFRIVVYFPRQQGWADYLPASVQSDSCCFSHNAVADCRRYFQFFMGFEPVAPAVYRAQESRAGGSHGGKDRMIGDGTLGV